MFFINGLEEKQHFLHRQPIVACAFVQRFKVHLLCGNVNLYHCVQFVMAEITIKWIHEEIMVKKRLIGWRQRHLCCLDSQLMAGLFPGVWSPPRGSGQRYTHGVCWWRRVDGLLWGLLHPPLSHRNSGASAGNQHLNAVSAGEHRYAQRPCTFIDRLINKSHTLLWIREIP